MAKWIVTHSEQIQLESVSTGSRVLDLYPILVTAPGEATDAQLVGYMLEERARAIALLTARLVRQEEE